MRRRVKVGIALGVAAFLVAALSSPDERPRSGPIVQRVGQDRATVLLHRVEPSTGTLRLFAADAEPRVVTVETATKRLAFELRGLTPTKRYDYKVEVRVAEGEPEVFEGSFRCAPPDGQGTLRFAALGDSGKIPWWTKYQDRSPVMPAEWIQGVLPGRGHQWEVAERLLEHEVQLALHLGDIVYPRGAREHYNEGYFDPFAEFLRRVPVWPTIGNHDAMTENAKPVLDFFDVPGRYYDFVQGPVHFFCIDTYTTGLETGSEQRKWLEESLANAAKNSPWRVAFTHRPFLTVSRSKDDAGNKMLREEIHPVLAKHGVALVLSGHDHNYQRFKPQDGVHYVVAGGGGKSLYELGTSDELLVGEKRYSFVVVDADAKTLRLRAIDEDGQEIDRFELARKE